MASWTPDPDQVKALIPTRNDGQAFSADTVPTAVEVAGIIDQVADEVLAEVGPFNPDIVLNPNDVDAGNEPRTLGSVARWAVTLGAAYYVEQGFFPEEVDGGDLSPAARLWERYQQQLRRLEHLLGTSVDAAPMFRGGDTPAETLGWYPADGQRPVRLIEL